MRGDKRVGQSERGAERREKVHETEKDREGGQRYEGESLRQSLCLANKKSNMSYFLCNPSITSLNYL